MKRNTLIWLILIFVLILGVRLFFTFSIDGVSYESYSILRNVDSIKDSGLPLFNDALSFGGREKFFSPIYHYMLAIFGFVLSDFLLVKIIPNIFISLLSVIVFFISLHFSKDEEASLLSALFVGFIPVLFNNTINNASIFSFVLPLFFLVVYLFLKSNQDINYLNWLVVSMIILVASHPMSIVFALGLLVYLLFVKSMGFRESSKEPEIVLFYLMFVLWATILVYKVALSAHGFEIIWQNLPLTLVEQTFGKITLAGSLYAIGVLPLIFGLSGLYKNLFSKKSKAATLMMSLAITFFILMFLGLVQVVVGLMFLGVILSILSAYALKDHISNLKKFKFKYSKFILILILIILLFASFVPNFFLLDTHKKDIPSNNDINAFLWIKNNTPENSSVLVLAEEGSVMSYYSNRKNVIDENYLLIKNINRRYSDLNSVYDEAFLTSALRTLTFYSVNYVVLTENNQKKFDRRFFRAKDNVCLPLIKEFEGNNSPKIFKVNCLFNVEN
ncbi:hypothetical protein K9L67_04295 [Candidatus Woesearchaeota archaeon]|nr:hypothetical protein [Candidatus Woesearchaeota archaeon]MCF7901419.1 hypothetical protein [Candidatus Woesearchaeota archaeon]MCF8012968.1 hypothetical protein [Candidatus Woesearchaeota archaeon]